MPTCLCSLLFAWLHRCVDWQGASEVLRAGNMSSRDPCGVGHNDVPRITGGWMLACMHVCTVCVFVCTCCWWWRDVGGMLLLEMHSCIEQSCSIIDTVLHFQSRLEICIFSIHRSVMDRGL